MRLRTLLFVVVALALVGCERLDRGFGTDGRVPLAVQPGVATRSGDGIVVLGTASSKPAIVRYDADGNRDMAFGGGDGVVGLKGLSLSSSRAMAPSADGGFVVVGPTPDHHGGIVKYTADGTVDVSFGDDGVARTPGTFDPAATVDIAADGRVAIGRSLGADVAMFTGDGHPDTAFGGDGVAVATSNVSAVAFQPDGNLVVAGTDAHLLVVRLQRDGTADPSFGTGGTTRLSTGDPYNEFPNDALVQPDGRVVVLARRFANGGVKQMLARFTADGRPDSSFGYGGVSFEGGSFERAEGRTMHLRPDGRIVTAGQTFGPDDLLTTQWMPNGTLDGGWGDHGDDVTSFGDPDSLFGGVLLDDGRLLGFGYADRQPVLVRYTAP
jgi:uncharacterized delta-60 repeat protein